jgi:CBS domain containing-hemolysin-like protein
MSSFSSFARRMRPALLSLALWPVLSHAEGGMHAFEEKIADFLGVAVLFIVPVVAIGVFLILHVMPEKIAHKRHHPQKDAIHTLCLLSLFFGGLLWPLAWLWAFTKPTSYKMAYGTDKHDDYFREHAAKIKAGDVTDEKLAQLSAALDHMASKGTLPTDLEGLRFDLAHLSAARSAAVVVPAASGA